MTRVAFVRPTDWTLRAKLVAAVIALFLAVTTATATATYLITRSYLTNQLDRAIGNSVARFTDDDHDGRGGPVGPGPGGGDATLRLALVDGQVIADRYSRRPINTAVNTNQENVSLTTAQISDLRAAGLGSTPHSVDLGAGLGSYRLVAVSTEIPVLDAATGAVSTKRATYITGMPTDGIESFLRSFVLMSVGGILIGLVLVTAGGTYLVRRNLEPLERVAGTARRVAGLKLDSGDVALAERVAERDTDPRTEVGQVGIALNTMLDNVEGALNARQASEMRVRRFVADASHELRTPLASIRGYAEISRRETEPVPDGITHALGRVESEAQRMTSLVEDLLLLARLDEGRPLEQEEVDLTMLAVDAVSDAHAASRDHQWKLDVPEEPITVIGDQARLHQVLTNLLANARVHTPAGTSVVTSLRHEGDQVRMSVTDNGPGIPESLQDKVFERFTRGDDARARTTGSTGLGLSIVSAVGAAHGGRVEVESRPGRTSFSVLLPA
jgi:two-component system OmpR family sensor kinase